MDDLTLRELIELGADTPVLILMAYFLYKLDKNFSKLATQIRLFMEIPGGDDNQ